MEESAAKINLQAEYKQIGFDILNGLDRLTGLARSYSQFGQKFYYTEYLYEFHTENIRGKTITQLKELGIPEDSLALVNKAIGYSNALAETEAKAFKAVEKNNYEQARNLLFGKEYNDRRNQIITTIKEFQISVNEMAEIEVNRAKQVITRLLFTTIALVFSTIMTAIASFVIITKKINSIDRLTEAVKEAAKGNLDTSITSDAKDEIGDLTRSFATMLKTIKSITTYLDYLAKTDTLTQVANRHSFLKNAPSFFDFHIRLGNPIAILFFDIDNFKSINDKFGHAFGDDVLKNFANIVSEAIRSFDLFCRYGGEEFILLLSNTDQVNAISIGKRIMKNIEQTVFSERPDFKYSTSAGLFTNIPQKGESVEEYINKADQAMYLAKKNGKNRIEVYKEK